MTTTTEPRRAAHLKPARLRRILRILAYTAVILISIPAALALTSWLMWTLTLLLGSPGAALADIGIGSTMAGWLIYQHRRD